MGADEDQPATAPEVQALTAARGAAPLPAAAAVGSQVSPGSAFTQAVLVGSSQTQLLPHELAAEQHGGGGSQPEQEQAPHSPADGPPRSAQPEAGRQRAQAAPAAGEVQPGRQAVISCDAGNSSAAAAAAAALAKEALPNVGPAPSGLAEPQRALGDRLQPNWQQHADVASQPDACKAEAAAQPRAAAAAADAAGADAADRRLACLRRFAALAASLFGCSRRVSNLETLRAASLDDLAAALTEQLGPAVLGDLEVRHCCGRHTVPLRPAPAASQPCLAACLPACLPACSQAPAPQLAPPSHDKSLISCPHRCSLAHLQDERCEWQRLADLLSSASGIRVGWQQAEGFFSPAFPGSPGMPDFLALHRAGGAWGISGGGSGSSMHGWGQERGPAPGGQGSRPTKSRCSQSVWHATYEYAPRRAASRDCFKTKPLFI